MERDLPDLKHWQDLTSGRFASRLKRAYPWLTNGEMNICCLQRMGYTVAEMSALLGVKEASVNRTVYRACERLNIGGNKQVFQTFIQGYWGNGVVTNKNMDKYFALLKKNRIFARNKFKSI